MTLSAARVPREAVGELGDWEGRTFLLCENEYQEFLEISVTDSGIGIAAEDLEHLFKPFSQIDSGLARKFEGTGLGLAMVKLLADLHGGSVGVSSAVGVGSRFIVWLPLRQPERRVRLTRRAPPLEMAAGPDARFALVVDDDVKSAGVIRVQLEAEGFSVLHAPSAEHALVLATQQPLALITLDIDLPDMDGWEFLARIKQVETLKHVPVVIISIAADFSKGMALGAAGVLQKPVTRADLYTSLSELGLFSLAAGETLKVLVVDDDPDAVELIAVQLTTFGASVLRAYGGEDAIDIARRELPGLIVLDLMMPMVNGFDVVEALRERPATAHIPVIVVTATPVTPDDRARLGGFVTAIMAKGQFDRKGFVAEVRRAMIVGQEAT